MNVHRMYLACCPRLQLPRSKGSSVFPGSSEALKICDPATLVPRLLQREKEGLDTEQPLRSRAPSMLHSLWAVLPATSEEREESLSRLVRRGRLRTEACSETRSGEQDRDRQFHSSLLETRTPRSLWLPAWLSL